MHPPTPGSGARLTPADPRSNDDFEFLSAAAIPSLNYSHVCISSPALPRAALPDQHATLQLRYLAQREENETFYLCSDVILVSYELIYDV